MKKSLSLALAVLMLFSMFPIASADGPALEERSYPFYIASVEDTTTEPIPLTFVNGVSDLPYMDLESWAELVSELFVDGLDLSAAGSVGDLLGRDPLYKVDADGGKDLAGACFVLQDEAGQYRTASGAWSASEDDAQVVATNDKGVASFVGLGAGTYTLTEKTAPEGYELLSAPVKVTLAPSDVETSRRTLTATAQGADATVEAVDAATGVAKVRVEDPRTGGSKTPGNTDSNNARGAGGGAGASGNASGATGTSGTSRTQLATTADPSPAAGTVLAIAAAGLVLAGVAKRRQSASTNDA